MYYVMNLPEWLILIFIIFLWIISILFCIKRFEKISTIERTSYNNQHKSKLNTGVSPSRLYQTLSNFNINNNQNTFTTMNNNNYFSSTFSIDELINKPKQKSSLITNDFSKDKICNNETEMFSNFNEFSSNSKYKSIFTQHRSTIMYRPTSMPNLSNISQSNLKNNKVYRNLNLNMNKSTNNLNKNNFYSTNDIDPLITTSTLSINDLKLKYRNSEFKVNIRITPQSNNNKNIFQNYTTKKQHQKLSNQQYNEMHNQSRINSKNDHHNSRKTSVSNRIELLDPNKIPKFIQKSFIDLHKKSMLNLAQKNSITNENNFFQQQRHFK
jgi:hypothetical protein